MLAKQVEIKETQTHLKELITLVQQGAEFLLTEDGIPVARLLPVETPPKKKRTPNLHSGGWISDDFTAPLPDDFWLGEDK